VTAGRQRRPIEDYYETRNQHLSQGDIFRDVPLAYPLPADEVVVDEDDRGARLFLSGPFETGLALLLTPSCSMTAQRAEPGTYAHPVRILAVIRTVAELVENGIFDNKTLGCYAPTTRSSTTCICRRRTRFRSPKALRCYICR